MDFFSELPGKFLNLGGEIVNKLWSGISGGWNWLADKVGGLVDSLLGGYNAGKQGDAYNPNIPEYALGTNYVPHDQMAMVHEGEAIVPADLNKSFKSNDSGGQEMRVSGTIRHEGINDKGELVATVEQIITNKLQWETMLAGGR